MSLRLLHTGDVHIGAKFLRLGEKAATQRDRIRQAFTRTIDEAIERKVQVVLITGDLFDNVHPSESSILFVKKELRRLVDAGIWTIIIPGTHDRLEPGSVFETADFSGTKVHVFNEKGVSYFTIDEIDATFYANPNVSNKSTRSPLSGFEKDPDSKYHIALAHGSYQITGKSTPDDYPITYDDISNSEMNYIALAHWHKAADYSVGDVVAWYCGSPEVVAIDQGDSGSVLLVELENNDVRVENVMVGQTEVKAFEIDLSQIKSVEELESAIIEHSNESLILRVTLRGIRNKSLLFDVVQLQEFLLDKFYFLEIKDESVLDVSSFDFSEYPDNFILGRFIKSVQESDLTNEEKSNSLRYGIPLLQGKKVL